MALTLLASFISPVTLLGNAAETYVYGAQYVVDLMQRLASMLTIVLLYVPVFYDLDITTSYQVRYEIKLCNNVLNNEVNFLSEDYDENGVNVEMIDVLQIECKL